MKKQLYCVQQLMWTKKKKPMVFSSQKVRPFQLAQAKQCPERTYSVPGWWNL